MVKYKQNKEALSGQRPSDPPDDMKLRASEWMTSTNSASVGSSRTSGAMYWKPRLGRVQAGDATQARHPRADITGRLCPQAVADDVHTRHVQTVIALRGRRGR